MNALQKFRKRPVEIEAIRVTPHNTREVANWVNGEPDAYKKGYAGRAYPDIGGVEIPVLPDQKHVRANWGDWVIRGVSGEFYPCEQDVFAATYEAVSE